MPTYVSTYNTLPARCRTEQFTYLAQATRERMRPSFRKRYISIAIPQLAAAVVALVTIRTEVPLWTESLAWMSLVGFGTILLFWIVFFRSFPYVSTGSQRMLFMLYRIGQAVFIFTLAIALWSVFSLFGDFLHWGLIGLGLLEFSMHFAVRWMDGNGQLFMRRPANAWRGGNRSPARPSHDRAVWHAGLTRYKP